MEYDTIEIAVGDTREGAGAKLVAGRSSSGAHKAQKLVDDSQQVAQQQDQQNSAKPNACAATCAPAVVAVVSATATEDQNQNND